MYIRYVEISGGTKFEQLEAHLTPSFYVRAAVLLLFAVYILLIRDRRAMRALVPIAVLWGATLLTGYFTFGVFDFFREARYMANFVSNLAVLFVYSRVFEASGTLGENLRARLRGIITLTLIVYSSAIILPYIFGLGYSTYTDRFGFRGARGFFYSGNDITAALMLLLPLSGAAFMASPGKALTLKNAPSILGPALAVNSLCLIGTKAAFISVGATALLFGAYALAVLRRDRGPLRRFGALAAGTALVFGLLVAASRGEILGMILNSLLMPGSIAEAEDMSTAIFSGRLSKLLSAFGAWRDGGPFVWLFGTGRAVHSKIIEMDVMEVLFYYGAAGGTAMLWPYLKLGFGYAARFFKGIRERGLPLLPLACLFSLVLGAAYLFLAGHILFSVTSGFYFSLTLLYAVQGEKPADN